MKVRKYFSRPSKKPSIPQTVPQTPPQTVPHTPPQTIPQTPPQTVPQTPSQIVPQTPSQTVLYQRAKEMMIIVPEIMSFNRQQAKLNAMKNLNSKSLPKFPDLVKEAIIKAFNLEAKSSHANPTNYSGQVADIASGNFYQGATTLFSHLNYYDQEALQLTLYNLIPTEDPFGLQVSLALMLRGANECQARKQFVLSSLIDRTHILNFQEESLELLKNAQEPWKRQLLGHLIKYLDDLKEKAFNTVFIEPSKLYFRLASNPVAEGDVDVHGANTYLGLLQGCLEVNLRRAPFLNDENKGCIAYLDHFKDGQNNEIIKTIWNDSNLGKSFEGIFSSSKKLSQAQNQILYSNRNYFLWGGFVSSSVKNALNFNSHSPTEISNRKKLEEYLEKYGYFFSEDYVLEGMYRSLALEEDMVVAMNSAYKESLNGEGDIRYWLWDMEQDPPVFQRENAKKFFTVLGIIKS